MSQNAKIAFNFLLDFREIYYAHQLCASGVLGEVVAILIGFLRVFIYNRGSVLTKLGREACPSFRELDPKI